MTKREEIAALCHEQWSNWMKHLFSKCHENLSMNVYPYGDLVIPKEFVDKWEKQMETDYNDLSEIEKESDRRKADKFIELINKPS